ncbi:MAG: TRAFs-binding domain-containing protein [Gallionella sp.]
MKTCFVVQGFGKKTDFTDGRILDLDASYSVIKEAVEAAGLECIRADEIKHSGTIDLPMYQQLLMADLVIADLSTYNVNAAFELGVRYGLRPHATIIVAEEGFKNPFDVGHIVIRRYKHLGEDIGRQEAKRFSEDIRQAIGEILADPKIDSPVYTFLHALRPPQQSDASPQTSSAAIHQEVTTGGSADAKLAKPAASPAAQSTKSLLDAALDMIRKSEFIPACSLLEAVIKLRPNDNFVVQQLALATYKSKQPDPEAALLNAKEILRQLQPASTNDPETLGLWGAIHKRLWEISHQDADLSESIAAYERGFYLKQDYYNGINLAFLLNLRALNSLKAGDRDEGIADAVQARRVRRDVIRYAEQTLSEDMTNDARYWVIATLWEAAVGLGDATAALQWESQARALKVPSWMLESTQEQLQLLQSVLAQILPLTK